MNDVFSGPTIVQMICFVVSLGSLLTAIYITILAGTTLMPRTIVVGVLPMIADLAVYLVVYDMCASAAGHTVPNNPFVTAFANLPAIVQLIIVGATLTSCLLRLRGVLRITSTNITPFSIGEALNKMRLGVVFAGDTGQVLQCNSKFDDMCFEITGNTMLNTKDFWDTIKKLDTNMEPHNPDEEVLLNTEDGTSWLITRTRLNSTIGEFNQILAVDATEERNLVRDLREANNQLEDMNRRLRRYNDTVDDTVRQEELLETKKRVHDNMGEDLLGAKIYITNEVSPVNIDELKLRWEQGLTLMPGEASHEEDAVTGQIKRLMDAANHLGIELKLTGEMPENFLILKLICTGIQECMTNAIQHAGADEMYVDIKRGDYEYIVNYSNNGAPLDSDFKEGGGLSLFREEAEKLGASLEYTGKEKFNLALHIPLPETEI